VTIDERVVVDDAVVDDALSADTEERIERLEAAIEKLKPDEKMLITLFYFDDKRQSEIAYIMGIDEGNVSMKLHRIRKKLYLLMEGRINERR
jgi:RNA polymerase sigma-70 factor (ECF subfamily)